MPFIPLANAVRVAVNYTCLGLEMANVLYMSHAAGALTVAEAETIAADINTAWAANVMTQVVDDLVMASVVVTDASSATGVQATQVATQAGTSTVAPCPPNIALCVTVRSTLRSRNGRGRIYLPGIGEDKVDGAGTVDNTFRNNVVSAFNDLATDLLASTHTLGMGVASFYSQTENPTPPHARAAGLFSPLSAFTVDATIDTQRRRLRN